MVLKEQSRCIAHTDADAGTEHVNPIESRLMSEQSVREAIQPPMGAGIELDMRLPDKGK